MGRFRGIELDDLELAGARLVVRPWRVSDVARVHDVLRHWDRFRFLALPDPYTAESAHEFVTGAGVAGRATGTGVDGAVVESDSDRVVGSASLRLVGEADIGYWIAPDARGRGYGAEVAGLLAAFAFAREIPRVALHCDVLNLASARTALTAGFGFEGYRRDGATRTAWSDRPDRHGDLAVFGRLPEDPPGPVPHTLPEFPPEGLTDGTVTIRVIGPDDAAALAETDDELAEATGFGLPHPTAKQYRRGAERAALEMLVGRAAPLAIEDVATHQLAGELTLRLAGPPQVGGIGYTVHPRFRGRGYTARALRLLAPWAFGHGFARLELGAKVDNVASQRAALAAGFQPDGILRGRLRAPDGSFVDEARFALLPSGA